MYSAVSRSFAPATTVVGMSLPTSSAWLGPDRTAARHCGISCAITSVRIISVLSSIPLDTSTISCPAATYGAIFFAMLRMDGDAVASTRISFPSTVCSRSVVHRMSPGSFTPGSFDLFSRSSLSMRDSSSRLDHNVTSCPFLLKTLARAVPQLPEPMTPAFAIAQSPLRQNHYFF